ncbi:MAG: PrsW family intramembrane metalloprotease [Deltaproteobacteria bacterium]|nr:PrsW family intramembrane metalloprotease [Deltaproteobacteria bacterium]MCW5808521.1 PrsW family intramembrane metalloprotease [Deltaproteobacteria bacterium]
MQRPRWSLRRARLLMGTRFVLVAGLFAFILIALAVELVGDLDHTVRLNTLVAAGMACVPAVFWLAFFYLMDRHEKEPKQLVAGVCVLGALVAAPLSDFVQYQAVPPVALEVHGLAALSLDRVVYAVCIVGLTQEMCKYAAVRYTIYLSREFNEPMDGIVYMMACGTGFAVWVNYHRLSDANAVHLSTGAARAVITTLAHASFAGALGYVMGRAKFSRRSAPVRGTLLMLGLLGAAVLNGGFALVEHWFIQRQTGFEDQPWRGVGYAALVAAGMFTLIWLLTQRLLAASPFRRDP